jgi:hypothetical protein
MIWFLSLYIIVCFVSFTMCSVEELWRLDSPLFFCTFLLLENRVWTSGVDKVPTQHGGPPNVLDTKICCVY